MIVKFTCEKSQLRVAVQKLCGIQNPAIERDEDLCRLAELLLAALGLQSEFIVPTACAVTGSAVSIELKPGIMLIGFGDASGIREADKRWMFDAARQLEDAIRTAVPQQQMAMSKRCLACNVFYPSFANFCRACGVKLEPT